MRTKEELPECPVATAVSLIGGKWKLLLLRNLKERPWRFNELQRSIDGISQKVLTESLRQMIDDGLAYRRDYHENPPKVEYGLTDLGMEMLPIVNALADFGNYYTMRCVSVTVHALQWHMVRNSAVISIFVYIGFSLIPLYANPDGRNLYAFIHLHRSGTTLDL